MTKVFPSYLHWIWNKTSASDIGHSWRFIELFTELSENIEKRVSNQYCVILREATREWTSQAPLVDEEREEKRRAIPERAFDEALNLYEVTNPILRPGL